MARRSRAILLLAMVVAGSLTLLHCVGDVKEIRLENASAVDFANVRFAGLGFGDLAAGETTDYRTAELNFRYGVLRLTAEGRQLTGQTLSFGARRFTYRIDIVDLEAGQLAIEVIRE